MTIDEQVEDAGERERERGRHEQPPGELVDVREPRARERLGEDEEEDDRRAPRRWAAGARRGTRGSRPARTSSPSAPTTTRKRTRSRTARDGLDWPRARERDERRGEEAEDVACRRPRARTTRSWYGETVEREHRHADDRREARELASRVLGTSSGTMLWKRCTANCGRSTVSTPVTRSQMSAPGRSRRATGSRTRARRRRRRRRRASEPRGARAGAAPSAIASASTAQNSMVFGRSSCILGPRSFESTSSRGCAGYVCTGKFPAP